MITKFNIFFTTLADTLSTHSVSADAARPWQLMFQDPATPIAEGVMDFHNDLNVRGCVCRYFCWLCSSSSVYNLYIAMLIQYLIVYNTVQLLEIVWTITPALILNVCCITFICIIILG